MKNSLFALAGLAVVLAAAPAVAQQDGERFGGIFGRYDGNGDGVVSAEEYLQGPARMFEMKDLDSNGLVTPEEFFFEPQTAEEQADLDKRRAAKAKMMRKRQGEGKNQDKPR